MVKLSPLFIEILIILLFIFLFQIFFNNRMSINQKWGNKHKLIIFFMCCFSIFLVMHYPFSFYPGNIYDLRKIPLLIGIFYGGYVVGGMLTLILLFYRFVIIGLDVGAFNSLILYSCLLIITFYLVPKYEEYSRNSKLYILSLIATVSSFMGPVFDFAQGVPVGFRELLFYFIYAVINGITMFIAIYLIENMREHNRMALEISQKEKMNVLSQLAASVAHEVRNPLTASRGFIQLAKESTKDKKLSFYLDTAMSEMDRSLDIINDYLSFAKPEFEQRQIIDVQELIYKTSTVIEPYAHLHNVSLHIRDNHELFIEGSLKKLTQCLVNIMKNGIEAMLEGGELSISSTEVQSQVVISISDSGNGMTAEQVKRIGTPFYSTKETGTGLGLMACFNIIEAMKGRIIVESEKNKGTTFHIYLPSIDQNGIHRVI